MYIFLGIRNLLHSLSSSLESLEGTTGFDLSFTFCKSQNTEILNWDANALSSYLLHVCPVAISKSTKVWSSMGHTCKFIPPPWCVGRVEWIDLLPWLLYLNDSPWLAQIHDEILLIYFFFGWGGWWHNIRCSLRS